MGNLHPSIPAIQPGSIERAIMDKHAGRDWRWANALDNNICHTLSEARHRGFVKLTQFRWWLSDEGFHQKHWSRPFSMAALLGELIPANAEIQSPRYRIEGAVLVRDVTGSCHYSYKPFRSVLSITNGEIRRKDFEPTPKEWKESPVTNPDWSDTDIPFLTRAQRYIDDPSWFVKTSR